MHLAIEHETHYRYEHPVSRSTQYLRLTPRPGSSTRVLSWRLDLPAKASVGSDAYGNVLHVLTLDKPHTEIIVRAIGVVETADREAMPEIDDALPPLLFLRDSPLTLADVNLGAFAQAFADVIATDRLSGLYAMMRALIAQMPYTPGTTDVATPAADAFARHLGVCQDHAQVFVACARRLGIPARYVSGYLAADAEHVASHAWAEIWMENGWLGFDVSNQCLAANRHVKIAIGLDYLDACPIRGMRQGGGNESMTTLAKVVLAPQGQITQ